MDTQEKRTEAQKSIKMFKNITNYVFSGSVVITFDPPYQAYLLKN